MEKGDTMRLIDADALMENLSVRYMSEIFPDWFEMPLEVREKIGLLGSTFKQAILNAPTIEAEPVVHCKECRHWGTGHCAETDAVKVCEYAKYMVGGNGYCVYGERR